MDNTNVNQNKFSRAFENEKFISEAAAHNFNDYFAKVERINRIFEDSFVKEREKCLTVFETEDRPLITNSNCSNIIETNLDLNSQVNYCYYY